MTGARHYFASVRRGHQTVHLLGPYDTEAGAEQALPQARSLAVAADPGTASDEFVVASQGDAARAVVWALFARPERVAA